MGEAGETYVDAQAEAFSAAIDDTYESRATTREKAWERIVALLRNNVRLDDCYQRCGTCHSSGSSSSSQARQWQQHGTRPRQQGAGVCQATGTPSHAMLGALIVLPPPVCPCAVPRR